MSTKDCPICNSHYDDSDEASKCFISHTKEEHLIWAFHELYKITADGYDRFDRMEALFVKYDWEEPDSDVYEIDN